MQVLSKGSATCKGTSTNQSHRIGNGNFHQLMAIAEGSTGNSSHGVREVNQAKLLCVDIVSCCSFHFVSFVFQSSMLNRKWLSYILWHSLPIWHAALIRWVSGHHVDSRCLFVPLLWGFSAQWDHHHKTSHALQLLHALDTCHFKDDDSTCQSAHCQFMVATAPSIGPWPLGHGFYRIGDSDRGHLAGLLMSWGLQLGFLPEAATEIHQFFAMFFLLHVWESRRRTSIIANETKVERPTLVIFENGKAYSWWLKFWTWALNAGFMSSLWYTNMMEQQKNKTDQIWKVFGTKRRNLFENTAVPSKLRHCPVYADINIKKTPPTRCIHCTKEVISGLTQGISNKNAKTFLHNSEAGIPLSPMRSNRNIYEYIYIDIYLFYIKHCTYSTSGDGRKCFQTFRHSSSPSTLSCSTIWPIPILNIVSISRYVTAEPGLSSSSSVHHSRKL